MQWIVFSYSLPSHANSSRVAIWRRLRRLGAISPTSGVFILPALDECVEAFQWLAQETHEAGGEALVMHVDEFQGMQSGDLAGLFNQARQEDYQEISTQLVDIVQQFESDPSRAARTDFQSSLARLQKQAAEISRIDYFKSPAGPQLITDIRQAELILAPKGIETEVIKPRDIKNYRDKTWVTRPKPHVDRLACAWLIRRYIDPQARIRYSTKAAGDEVSFDMSGSDFGHTMGHCTFETMLHSFAIEGPALLPIAEIVHEIDLRDGLYQRPESSGIDAVLQGWLLDDLSDETLENHGLALFDGLFASLSNRLIPGSSL